MANTAGNALSILFTNNNRNKTANTESIKCIIEDQTFSPSYDSAPFPSLSRLQVVSLSPSSSVSPVELDGGGEGVEAKSYDGEKAWSYINHSILSDQISHLCCLISLFQML